MSEVTLTATTGRETGSARSRRMRAEGRIPATVYGMGREPVSVTIERADLRRAMTTEAGVNALIRLDIDGESDHALVKEIQRHPVRRDVIHLDLQRIDPAKPMLLTVPIELIGDSKKVTSAGGVIELKLRQLKVSVRPDSIPTHIVVDQSEMVVDDMITVGEMSLPDGVSSEVDEATPGAIARLTRAAMVAQRQAARGEEPAPGAK